MSDEKFKDKYRIKSARALWNDYGSGACFVTVCTGKHEHAFGKIVNDPVAAMQLSPVGQYLHDNIQNTTIHYPYAVIPLFVVMPNHWHAIVFIDGDKTPYSRRMHGDGGDGTNIIIPDIHTVQTGRAPSSPQNTIIPGIGETGYAPSVQPRILDDQIRTLNDQMRAIDAYKGWLSVVIGGIKSSVTRFVNRNNMPFSWLPRFHDRIIRDPDEMNRIADYIENNPATWGNDRYNV
jgi:REP element-mobilizing transposase RayT